MTRPVNSNRPGTLPCVGEISGASTLAALAVPAVEVPREAELPVLALPQVLVDLVQRHVLVGLVQWPVLADLAQRPVLADLARLPVVLADPPVKAEVPAEEVSVEVRHRLLSAATGGRLPPVRRRFGAVPRLRPSPKGRRCPSA